MHKTCNAEAEALTLFTKSYNFDFSLVSKSTYVRNSKTIGVERERQDFAQFVGKSDFLIAS